MKENTTGTQRNRRKKNMAHVNRKSAENVVKSPRKSLFNGVSLHWILNQKTLQFRGFFCCEIALVSIIDAFSILSLNDISVYLQENDELPAQEMGVQINHQHEHHGLQELYGSPFVPVCVGGYLGALTHPKAIISMSIFMSFCHIFCTL